MADNTDYTNFDPSWSLSQGDPLREWANNNLDWRTGKLLQQDPQSAIESFINRGVPPPSTNAPLAYTGEAGMGGAPDPDNVPIRTNADGTIAGNITSPAPPGGNSSPPGVNPQTSPLPKDLPNTSPTPKQTPSEDDSTDQKAQDAADDAEEDAKDAAKKKSNDTGEALSGFAKSLAGVKAPPTPKLSPVGTPGVPHPNAVTPDISKLMGLLQAGAVPSTAAPGTVLANLLRR